MKVSGDGRKSSFWKRKLRLATKQLVRQYGTPSLGNFKSPTKEIFYILLSARTNEKLYQQAHSNLLKRFPTINKLAKGSLSDIQSCIELAGFGAIRAKHINQIANKLINELGHRPDKKLESLSPSKAFEYLITLPGIGPKSALCIMMCSLDHDVFPVDINVQRVFERLGIIEFNIPHYKAQKIAPIFVPDGLSKKLHVGLLEHGRKICTPKKPKCNSCFLSSICSSSQ